MHENIHIIDLANLFIRSYVVYPTMSSNGEQMGGVVGTLKTLRRLIDDYRPSSVYVVWESGGSPRRRALFPAYKLNRRPERLNRWYGDDLPESEENQRHQKVTLMKLLKHLPVCQLYVPDCEGDDVMSYLCACKFRDNNKTIVSSDRDMYQLLDDKTKQYSLHKKNFVTREGVLSEFRITARNFAVAKAICGDAGDNVPGVKGLGFKKLVKLFPVLGHEGDVTLQDVFSYSASHVLEGTLYKKILDSRSDIERNWKLVYLNGNMLSATQASRIDEQLASFVPRFDKMGLIKELINVGLNDVDVDGLGYAVKGIPGVKTC